MNSNIAIIGFGDLGEQFYNFLSTNNKQKFIFFDDKLFEKGKKNNIFSFKEYSSEKFNEYNFYVALGYHHLEKKLNVVNQLLNLKRNIPYFSHSSCFVNFSAIIGPGTFIYPMCNIDQKVKIGKGVLLNNSVCISHNSTIGDGCYISPGVIVSGHVKIGHKTFIGSGSVISNNIKIGNNVKIGIGSIVAQDIPDNCSALGNPIRILQKNIKLI